MLIIRSASWFSVLRSTVRVLLAGKELNASFWPQLLRKAGLALLQYPCWHRALSVQGLHRNTQQNSKTSLIPRQSPGRLGPGLLKKVVVFHQIKDIQLILRSYLMHSDTAVCHIELCLEAWSGL